MDLLAIARKIFYVTPVDAFKPIGTIHSCFGEKFGVPRQSLMVSEARAVLKLNPVAEFRQAVQRLDAFSHIWVLFVFHKNGGSWHPIIDPPRIGAASEVGVFASRSPHRPNPIGFSVVKLDRVDVLAPGGIEIHVSGVDILDQSPLLDIKPYLPYADIVSEANSGWAQGEIERYPVALSEAARSFLQTSEVARRYPNLESLVRQMLEWDPRPTSQRRSHPMRAAHAQGATYAFRVLGVDVHWRIEEGAPYVVEIRAL